MIRAVAFLATVACGASTSPPPAVAPAPPPIAWFDAPDPWPMPSCQPDAPAPSPLHQTLPVTLLRGPGVSDAVLLDATRSMQRTWSTWGVRLVLAGPVQEVSEPWLLGDGELAADAGDAEALALAVAPLRAFLATHAAPRHEGVVVAVLPQLSRPGSWAAAAFADLRGLTLSPFLDRSLGGTEAGQLQSALQLGDAFTPTIFLSATALGRLPTSRPHLVSAHELGHALGLPHHPDPRNLMHADPGLCVPVLSQAQLDGVGAALEQHP